MIPELTYGENTFQKAEIEENDKTIDYEISGNLTYTELISVVKGLNLVSEFYDVNCACSVKGSGICAVALGQALADAVQKVMDSNPIDFMTSVIVVSTEVDSEIARFLKDTNIIAAPKFTANALEILNTFITAPFVAVFMHGHYIVPLVFTPAGKCSQMLAASHIRLYN